MKMCVPKGNMDKCKTLNRGSAGRAVRGVLTKARAERRLTCGLLAAIKLLEKDPGSVMFCVVAETVDSCSHMQAVLLQAFCYENEIPVIQVDNSETLAYFCGIPTRKGQIVECACALVTHTDDSPWTTASQQLSQAEQTLSDFYECTFYEFPRPTIKLPPCS